MNATIHLPSSLLCASMEKRRAGFAQWAGEAPAGHATEFLSGMHAQEIERTLAKDQLLVMGGQDGRLTCLDGMLWVTREGDFEDYILDPGRSFTVRQGDKVTVQAMRPSRLRLAAG